MGVITSAVQLLFGRRGRKTIGGLNIDGFLEENHEQSAQVTAYPIEDGSVINDHVVHDPDKLSIVGVVAPSSIFLTDIFDFSFSRVVDIYWQLTDMKTAGQPITVVSGLRVYNNMIIESFSVSRNKDTGKGMDFNMTLSKARIVQSQTTAISKNTIGKQTPAKVSVAKVATSQPQEAERPSFLAAIKAGV